MPYLAVVPETLASAASDLAGIGSAVTAANAAAAAPTTGVLAAAGDEVSAAVASLFSGHAQAYQALSAQAAAFHAQFVSLLKAGAGSYVGTETANAAQSQSGPGYWDLVRAYELHFGELVDGWENDLPWWIYAEADALAHAEDGLADAPQQLEDDFAVAEQDIVDGLTA